LRDTNYDKEARIVYVCETFYSDIGDIWDDCGRNTGKEVEYVDMFIALDSQCRGDAV